MPNSPLTFNPSSAKIVKGGEVVGLTDRVYELAGNEVVFDEVLVKGDLSGDLDYNDHQIRVVRVDTAVGMLVDDRGVRGPVWKGVVCEVKH